MVVVSTVCLVIYALITAYLIIKVKNLEERASELQEELEHVDSWLEENFGPDGNVEL